VIPRDPALAAPTPRDRFRSQRVRLLQASALVILPLGGVGWLLAAPHELGAVRLGGVGVGWWLSGLAWALGLLALPLGPRPPRRAA
jgi:hypothetical protein